MTAFASTLVEGRFDSRRVAAEVEYRLLLPQGVSGPLPLIQHLHGAMSSAGARERARPGDEAAWAGGTGSEDTAGSRWPTPQRAVDW